MHENRETSEMPAATVGDRTAGKGSGHAARMYVSEESHSGIVPMNHSNKDGASLAESEEGRLLIKENALPSDTYPTQSGGLRVSHRWTSVRTSSMLGRYSSEIRTGCANERPSGSVRGAISNGCPYRDPTTEWSVLSAIAWLRQLPRNHFYVMQKKCRQELSGRQFTTKFCSA